MLLNKNFIIVLILLNMFTLKFYAENIVENKKINKLKKFKKERPYKNILLKNLIVHQLKEVIFFAKKHKNKDLYLESMRLLIIKSKEKSSLILELADFYFKKEMIEEAVLEYQKFIENYPGNEEYEYVFYKLILAYFLQTLPFQSDTSIIEKTISLINGFLVKAKNKDFIKEVEGILVVLNRKLFDHEIHVLEQYIRDKAFIATEKRFKYIVKYFSNKNIFDYEKEINNLLNKILILKLN